MMQTMEMMGWGLKLGCEISLWLVTSDFQLLFTMHELLVP